VLAELQRIVAEAGEEAEVRLVFHREPLTVDREAAVARCVRESAAAVTGREPEEAGVAYWMDAAIFAAAGIPTVNYGHSGAGAHEDVEWADAASVVSCGRVLVESARRFCAA
jgi:acetylornithine deacetylase